MEIEKKHVLITGAGKRVGRALADFFLTKSVRLTAHYGSAKTEADCLVADAKSRGLKAHAVQADLRNVADIRRAVGSSIEALGPIDILINSASVFFRQPSEACSESDWDTLMDVDLKGQFFFCQAVGKSMQKASGGVILNIVDSLLVKPPKGYAPYQAAKAGLRMLTRSLALEWAPKIRVNSISPGTVLLPEGTSPEDAARWISKNLFPRVGAPLDIAYAAKFLIESDYITGFDLCVDGGRSII